MRFPIVLLMLLLMVTGLFSIDAHAQSRSDRYTIRVYEDGDMCRYQIQDHADQDLFNISPGGTLTIQVRGPLWVDASVQDDPRGTPGTRSQRSVAVREENGDQSLTVRSEIGRSTEHKVQIQCCPSRQGRNECPAWVDAMPPQTTTGAVKGSQVTPLHQISPRGPAMTEPYTAETAMSERVDSPQPPGGPVMRVDEN